MNNEMTGVIISYMKEYIKEKEYSINVDDFEFEICLYREPIIKNQKIFGYKYSDILTVKSKGNLDISFILIINSSNIKDVSINIVDILQKRIDDNRYKCTSDALYHLIDTDPEDYVYGKTT